MSEPTYILKVDASAGHVWTDTARTVAATLQGDVVQGLTDQSGNAYHASYDGSSSGGPALKLDTDNGVPALDFAAGKTLSFGNPAGLNTAMAGKSFTVWITLKTGPTLVDGDYPLFFTKCAAGEGRLALIVENRKLNNYTHFVDFRTLAANTLYIFRFTLTDASATNSGVGYEAMAEGGGFPLVKYNASLSNWDTTHALRLGALTGFNGTVDWLLYDLRMCVGIPTQEQIDTVERALAVKYRTRSDVNLIGVGNSIMAGYGLSSPSTQSLLAVAGATAGLPSSNILNLAVGGTYAYQWRYNPLLYGIVSGSAPSPVIPEVRTAIRPSITRNLIVVTLPDNDIWGSVPPEEVYDTTLGCIRYYLSLGCEVIATTCLPRYTGVGETNRTAFNGYLRAGASVYGYTIADLAANSLIGAYHANEDGSGGYTASTYYQDGTHPNAAGAAIAGAIVADAIAASVPRTTATSTVTLSQQSPGQLAPNSGELQRCRVYNPDGTTAGEFALAEVTNGSGTGLGYFKGFVTLTLADAISGNPYTFAVRTVSAQTAVAFDASTTMATAGIVGWVKSGVLLSDPYLDAATSGIAATVLIDPENKLLTDASGYVTATNGGGGGDTLEITENIVDASEITSP